MSEPTRRITTIDAHTAGEPLRIVTGGIPEIPGETILDKRRYAQQHLDSVRRFLMWEPRGHADMYGAIPTPAASADGDVGVLFLHNEGFSTMCGHGIIGLVKVGLEEGLFEADPQAIRIDTPVGRVTARAEISEGEVRAVTFVNVPSFALVLDGEVPVDGIETPVRYDVAFGGAFYAYVEASDVGIEVDPSRSRQIADLGTRIKRAVAGRTEFRHPSGDADLEFLYGTIFSQAGDSRRKDVSRNVCVFADGEIDRSPTGTGISGRAALLHARGALEVGEWIEIESILGTSFEVRIVEAGERDGVEAVVPEVRGSAYITGRHEFSLDEADPLGEGFLVK